MCKRYVTKRLATLTVRELKAVMNEAITQYVNREENEHTDIISFIENGLDMLQHDTYVVVRDEYPNYALKFRFVPKTFLTQTTESKKGDIE